MFTTIDKAIVGAIMAVIAMLTYAGVTVPEWMDQTWANGIATVLAPLAIWAWPNKPAKPDGSSVQSPWLVGILAVLLTSLMLAGCGVQRPKVDSVSDAIATTAAEVESVANQVQLLCGNEQPGGECLVGATLSTEQKNDIRDRLQEAQDALVLANTALAVNDAAAASGRLEQADAILRLIREELAKETSP